MKKRIITYIIILLVLLGIVFIFVKKGNTVEDFIKESETPLVEDKNKDIQKENSDEFIITNIDKEKFDSTIKPAQQALLRKEYTNAIKYYNEALVYEKSDVVYSGMFNVYSAQENWDKALEALDKAIEIDPTYTEYWIWKIGIMNEKKNVNFQNLKSLFF